MFTRPSESQAKTVPHQISDKELNVPCFENLSLKKQKSDVWGSHRRWDHETDIRTIVKMALEDCARAASVFENLNISQEVPFGSVVKKNENRTDLAIVKIKSRYGLPTAAVEIKKPPNDSQKKEFDMEDAQQIVQYMYDLRCAFGVRFVFGILTTYSKWRIFWFEDSNDAIMCDDSESFKELCAPSPSPSPTAIAENDKEIYADKEAKIQPVIKVMKSKIFLHDDVQLVKTLCTLLLKCCMIPHDRVNGYLHENRLYQTGSLGKKDENGFVSVSSNERLKPHILSGCL